MCSICLWRTHSLFFFVGIYNMYALTNQAEHSRHRYLDTVYKYMLWLTKLITLGTGIWIQHTNLLYVMFIVEAHWSIPSQMTICNQAYFLQKTTMTRQYFSILFSAMVLLLWRHIVLLFDRNVTQVLLWYLKSQYDVAIVAPCPRL